jgi:Asp-tRNA(Asn)/Glu-tRNA(Gln) amidotransferase B subunit
MPETNLPPLRIHIREDLPNKHKLIDAVALKKQLPEMPEQIRQRLKNDFNIPPGLIMSLMVNLHIIIKKYINKKLIFHVLLERFGIIKII